MTNPAVHDSSASGGTDTLPAAIGCRPVNRWLPWGVGVGVILLGAALVWTWPELAARSSLDLEGPLVAQALPPPDGLYVFAAISRSSIARGSHQFLTVFLANRSAARIESLHLRILVPTGFEIPDASVIDAAVNKPLLPGGGRRITVSLVAQKLGRFQLPIAVEWRDAKHGVSGTTISLKPVVVINPYMRATARVLSGFVGLFKDLGLPIVAALFAWWLKRRDDTRQLQQAAQQRLDEERRHEAETERARIQETWNLMLPITHQYNGKYYVRLVGAADRFARRAAECKPADDPRCLYLLLTMLRQVRRITLEVGGLFLKNWRAEEVVKEAWEAFEPDPVCQVSETANDRVPLLAAQRSNLRNCQINVAAALLRNTKLRVDKVGYAAGFETRRTFYCEFRQRKGSNTSRLSEPNEMTLRERRAATPQAR